MMQEFKPECTINLHVDSIGTPPKYIWICSVRYLLSRVVVAKGFTGSKLREDAQLAAALFGLRQAYRLKQEKVALACSFPGILSLSPKKNLELQSKLEELHSLWEGFRLKKTTELDKAERDFLQNSSSFLGAKKKRGK